MSHDAFTGDGDTVEHAINGRHGLRGYISYMWSEGGNIEVMVVGDRLVREGEAEAVGGRGGVCGREA